MTAAEPAEVAVVGAGPVGLITALLLARQGHSVVLLERWQEPYPSPARSRSPRSHYGPLHLLGLGDALDDMVLHLPQTARAEVRNGAGTVLHSAPMPPGPDGLPAMATGPPARPRAAVARHRAGASAHHRPPRGRGDPRASQ